MIYYLLGFDVCTSTS